MQEKIETKIPERTVEQVALIRKIIKKKIPKVRVTMKRGTAWGWVAIRGTADEFGNFTEAEQQALVELKLANGLPFLCNEALIRPEDLVYMIKLWTGQPVEEEMKRRKQRILDRFYD